jgi:hypothetical protein
MMSWWVSQFSSNRLHRELFWHFALIGRFMVVGFLGLLLIPSYADLRPSASWSVVPAH